jgi:hypothetical protein
MSIADHPFFLQIKQANASVLEAYAGKSVYARSTASGWSRASG